MTEAREPYTFESYAAPTVPGTPPGTVPYAMHAAGARAVAADLLARVARLEEELRAVRWDYDEAMLQYNAAQKRACDAGAALPAAVAAEREACALLCQRRAEDWATEALTRRNHHAGAIRCGEARACAKDIRDRGQG